MHSIIYQLGHLDRVTKRDVVERGVLVLITIVGVENHVLAVGERTAAGRLLLFCTKTQTGIRSSICWGMLLIRKTWQLHYQLGKQTSCEHPKESGQWSGRQRWHTAVA